MTLDPRFADPAALAAEQQQQAAQAQAYLDQLRAANNANRPRTVGQVAGDLGAQLLQGAVGLGQAAYGAGNLATLGYLDRATGMSGNFKQTNDIINSWKSAQTQAALARSSAAFDRGIGAGMYNAVTDPLLLLDLLGQNALSVVPAAAGAQFASKGLIAAERAPDVIAKVAAQGAARAGGAQAAGASNVDIVNAARDAGMDDGAGQLAGLVGGVATGAMTPAVSRITGAAELEGQLAAKLLGQTAAASATKAGLVRAGLAGLAKEGSEETIQSGAEQLIQNLSVGKPAMEGVAEKAALGGIAGGMLGFGFGAYAGPRSNTPQRQEINAQLQQAAADAGVPSTGGALSSPQSEFVGPLDNPHRDNELKFEPGLGVGPHMPPKPAEVEPGIPYERLVDSEGNRVVSGDVITAASAGAIPGSVPGTSVVPTTDISWRVPFDPSTVFVTPDGIAATREQYEAAVANSTASALPAPPQLLTAPPSFGRRMADLKASRSAKVQAALDAAQQRMAETAVPIQQAAFDSAYQGTGDPSVASWYVTEEAQAAAAEQATRAEEANKAARAEQEARHAIAVDRAGLVAEPDGNGGFSYFTPGYDTDLQVPTRTPVDQKTAEQLIASQSSWEGVARAAGATSSSISSKSGKAVLSALNDGVTPLDDNSKDHLLSTLQKLAEEGNDSAIFHALWGKYGKEVEAYGATPALVRDGALDTAAFSAEVDRRMVASPADGSLAALRDEVTPLDAAKELAVQIIDEAPDAKSALSLKADLVDAVLDRFTDGAEIPKSVSDALQYIHDAYEAKYPTPEPEAVKAFGRHSRTGAATVVHEEVSPEHWQSVTDAVTRANEARSDREAPVTAFRTVQDFRNSRPMEVDGSDTQVPSDAKGVFMPDGTVALIAENLRDAEDAAKTVMHERTHEGMRGLLGGSLETVTNRLWANAGMRNRLREKMKLGLDRATAAEEVLTDMAENGEKLTGDVRSKIKSGIAKAFHALLGSSEYNVTDADVDALLKDVANYRATGASEPTSRMGQAEAFAELDKLLVSPADDRVTGIRFSRAIDDLRKLATEDTPNVTAANAIGGAVKDVTSYVAGLLSAVRGGKFGSVPRFLYRFVGPTQLHASFGKLWHDAETGANSYDSFNRNYQAWADDRQTMVHAYGEDVERAYSAMAKASPAKTKVWNALVQYSTFFQLFPGRDVQPEGNAYANDAERAEAKTYLDALWNKLGPDEQALYNKVQENYKKIFSDRYNAIKSTLLAAKGIESLETATPEQRASFMYEFGDLIESLMKSNGNAPYSPLRRYGNFMVSVVDDKGKQVWFSGHDTEAEAVKFAADQRARFGDGFKVSTMQKAEFNLSLDGVDTGLINRLRKGIAATYPVVEIDPNATAQQQAEQAARNKHNAEMQAAVGDALVDAYLHSIPQNSLMNSAHARKYIDGFPLDAHRAYHGYVLSASSNIANIRYSGALTKDLSDMASHVRKVGEGNDSGVQMMNVLNAVRGQYEGSRSSEVNPFAQAINTASFLWMLTSPSQMFMNGMQTPMVAAPRMAARFGTATATSKLMAAAKQYFTKEGILGDPTVHPAVAGVLNTLHQTGMDDFTLASTMADIAQGGDSDANSAWRKITRTAAWAMHKSEVFNRQVTAHAFASMALEGIQADPKFDTPEKVQAELLRQTRDFIDNQSHFNYDPHNAPEMMQGPWKKVIMQFQRYRLNMLAMLARDLRGAELGKLLSIQPALNPEDAKLARKTLLYTIGTQAAMTGAVGTVLSPAVFFIMDAFKDDDDLLDSRTEFIQSYGQIMSHGLLGGLPLLNLDPSRIESGSVLPFIGDRQYTPKDKPAADVARYYMEKLLGPAAGLGRKMWEGTAALTEGDIAGAYKMLPAPLADVAKTASELDGVRDKRGVKYYDPTILDSLKGVLGLRSADRLEAEEKRGAVYQAEAHVKALSKRALTKAAVGFATGDAELQQEGTDRFMELAGKHPELVKGSELRRAIAGVAKAQYNADRYGIPQSSRSSDEVLSAVGE